MVGAFSRPVAAFLLVLSGADPVRACPLCESESGERVRAGIFNPDFGYNLLATVLPFSLFLAMVALIHFGPPWPRISAQAGRSPRSMGGETAVTAHGEGQ